MNLTDTRPRLLLIATGARAFREYLLSSIAAQYRVHLFCTAEPSWERPYLCGSTALASTLDADALIAEARRIHAADPLQGVVCWDEARIQATSEVAAALGLPGPSPEAVRNCRDKHRTRTALAAGGVPQPQSILVGTLPDALAAAERIGYPVVLKPRALAASLGVVLVRDPAELAERFAFTRDTTVPGAPLHDIAVLVEEFADGPEISIDAAVYRGDVRPICLAHKEIGYPPYFEEIGHRVHAADPLLDDQEILQVLRAAHAAVGFSEGMTHTELRLTRSGPKVVEINARLGGDLIPYLGLRTSGIDPGLAAAALACGAEPDTTPRRSLHGAVRFSYVAQDTTVARVAFDTVALPPAIDLAMVLAEAGHTYSPPPAGTLWGRIAYVTAVAARSEQCAAALSAAERAIRVEAA
jgi:biotin carboxylase